MIKLNKTELGQFDDPMCSKIRDDFEEVMKNFLLKYEDIDTSDLQAILCSQMSWLINKYHLMHNMSRLMKERGYKSSDEAKTVRFIAEEVK